MVYKVANFSQDNSSNYHNCQRKKCNKPADDFCLVSTDNINNINNIN